MQAGTKWQKLLPEPSKPLEVCFARCLDAGLGGRDRSSRMRSLFLPVAF